MQTMRSVRRIRPLAAFILATTAMAAQAGPRFEISDLGTTAGFSRGMAVNDAAGLAGFATQPDNSIMRAVTGELTPAAALLELPSLGGSISEGFGINGPGEVAGLSYVSGDAAYRAVIWRQGQIVELGTLGGTHSRANALNDTGAVVGVAALPGDANEHAFLWQGGQMQDLFTLGGTLSQANGINAAGQITGYSALADGSQHAFFWHAGHMRDLGTLGGRYSEGHAINDAGAVVGYSTAAGDTQQHATLWRAGMPPRDLGTLGGISSEAFAVNTSGQVVGNSTLAGDRVQHAFLWENGGIHDLNSLIPAGTGIVVVQAYGISDAGYIVGAGRVGAHLHAVLLTPDKTPPQITCPADIAASTSPSAIGKAIASDNLDPAPTVVNDAPPVFPANAMTPVMWTATDANGNKAGCLQQVTVGMPTPATPPATAPGTASAADPGASVTPAVPVRPPSLASDPAPTKSPTPASDVAFPPGGGGPVLQVEASLKPLPRKIKLNASLTYRFLVTNLGTGPAASVVFRDELSPRLRYWNVVSSAGTCGTPAKGAARGILSCELGELQPGQRKTVVVTVKPRKRGAVVNRGIAETSPGKASFSRDSAEIVIKVR